MYDMDDMLGKTKTKISAFIEGNDRAVTCRATHLPSPFPDRVVHSAVDII